MPNLPQGGTLPAPISGLIARFRGITYCPASAESPNAPLPWAARAYAIACATLVSRSRRLIR